MSMLTEEEILDWINNDWRKPAGHVGLALAREVMYRRAEQAALADRLQANLGEHHQDCNCHLPEIIADLRQPGGL